jgi:hypothetical protein
MSSRRLNDFLDALAAGRRPESYKADSEDVDILRAAIALRAARPGDDVPDEAFVAGLQQSLEEQAQPLHDNVRPMRIRRSRAALAAVAASAVLVGGTYVATEATIPAATTTAAIAAPHGKVLRTATFETPQGHALGQIVVYNGSPGWVFMNVDVPTTERSVKCELRMQDGSVVAAGTVNLHDGAGMLAKKIDVDAARLRGATLSDTSGVVVGRATFA